MNKRVFLLGVFGVLIFGAKAQEVTLTVSDVVIEPSGRATLTIDSDVTLENFCSFQFDVLLPEGITIPYNINPDEEEEGFGYYDGDKEEWISAVESGICKSSHVLECSAIQGGYRFVCYHNKFTVFKSGSKNVLTLVIQASSDMANGVYRVALGEEEVLIANETDDITPSAIAGKIVVTGSEESAIYSFEMTDAGWGTLMLPFETDVPEGLTAYACNEVQEDQVVLVSSKKIEANTPYVMKGEKGCYEFTGIPDMTEVSYSSGLLTGVYVDTEITEGYVLQKLYGQVAFYRVDENSLITVPSMRCYLNVLADNAPMVRLSETTGIDRFEASSAEVIYDMSGKRIDQMIKNTLYIQGDRKMLVK